MGKITKMYYLADANNFRLLYGKSRSLSTWSKTVDIEGHVGRYRWRRHADKPFHSGRGASFP